MIAAPSATTSSSTRALSTLSSGRFWTVVALLTIVGTALRAWHMTAQNLWYDEIETVRIAQMSTAELARGFHGELPLLPTAWLSPLYFALLHALLLVPGVPLEAMLRGSSVVIGAATIPALAWTGRALVGPRAALAATCILAVSPFHVWYSQEVRPYALLVLASVVTIGLFHRALLRGGTRAWSAFAAAAIVALYTHPTAIVVLLVCAVALVVATRARSGVAGGQPGVWRAAVAAAAVIGVAYLPAMAMIRARGGNDIADPRGVSLLDLPYALYAYAVGFSLGPSSSELHLAPRAALAAAAPLVVALAVIFAVLATAGVVAVSRGVAETADAPRADAAARALVLAWLALPLAVTPLLALATRNPFSPRYAITAFPAFVLVLGAGVRQLAALATRSARGDGTSSRAAEARTTARRVSGAVTGIALGLVATVSMASLYNLATDPRYAKEDCRAAADFLAGEARAGDLVIVSARYMETAVRHYYAGAAAVIGYDPPAGADAGARAAAELADLVDGHPRVWLVRARAFHGDRDGLVPAALATLLEAGAVQAFPGVTVQRFTAPADGRR